MASPPPPLEDAGAVAVCCMCGDHGLKQELFRCRSCRVRLQHSYCSDLYPRATAYRCCNWCLREPAQGGGGAVHAAAADKQPTETKRKAVSSSSVSDEERGQRHERCSRRSPAEIGQPVKKKRKADDEKMPPATSSPGVVKGPSDASSSSARKEQMRAGKTRVRVKVRRYRLLAEVIRCY